MKKTLIAIVSIVLVLALNVGSYVWGTKLRSNKEDLNQLIEKDTEEAVVVNVWMKSGNISNAIRIQLEQFNAKHKDIKIVYRAYDDDYYNMLRTSLVTENGPDIFENSYDWDLLKQGRITDLDELSLNLRDVRDDVYYIYDEKKIGVNLTADAGMLIWNKDIFKEAGIDENTSIKTWDELLAVAEKIKSSKDDVIPFGLTMNSFNMEDLQVAVGLPSAAMGNTYPSLWDYRKGQYEYSNAKDIINFYKNLYEKELIYEDFDKKTADEKMLDFYSGKTAMVLVGTGNLSQLLYGLPPTFEYGVTDVPVLESNSDVDRYFINPSTTFFVNSKSIKNHKKKEAIEKVYNYMLEKENNLQLLKSDRILTIASKNMDYTSSTIGKCIDIDNYEVPIYDPTLFIGHNYVKDYDLINSVIKGELDIDKAIKDINDSYNNEIKIIKDVGGLDLTKYKEN
ncbi:MAG: extracellular solute-binding protein [Clostridiales bacterium]|uniref:ABC transporter substrate-binding protein n=1 Tax=Clostridium sp. N3C TaxID=1776758 RepID=UPI00092DF58C|nr:extracellular solute-binding protein [Clostridium sp. N3C]NLZ49304.1 extracellular solute-binding protein [Clostridiales bacterium]SCN23781.1 sn-glycerol-3-phosphate-binding periplasmic protein UgpB precursor [Clostridium sp. N3C]